MIRLYFFRRDIYNNIMEKSKTSLLSNGLIWFGAAISIAEIFTGTYFAPLGFKKGLLAIIIGHAIGAVLMYLVGYIGAQTEKSAMETAKMSFGKRGSVLFSALNVLQLIGWAAVLIASGGSAGDLLLHAGGVYTWSIIIGLLMIIWVLIGLKNLEKLNIFAMSALFILTIVMSAVVFKGENNYTPEESISFGLAVELAVAMPLSWLPVISDYTREVRHKKRATAVSAASYFIGSSWMYIIGMGAALFTGESDIAKIMLKAGLGIAALVTVVVSTVTTNFIAVYSAGVSSKSICSKLKEKPVAVAVCIISTLLAIFTPIERFEEFLYLIGSVFAPMVAVQIADFYIINRNVSNKSFSWTNLIIWAVGFIIYRILMNIDIIIGNTVPTMLIVVTICCIVSKIKKQNISV